MATIKITLDLPSKDAAWLGSLEHGTELVIIKERGSNSGLIPQAVLTQVEEDGI